MNLNIDNKNGFWKYEEDVILKEIRDYLGGTYKAHYANDNKTQTLDLIDSIGDSEHSVDPTQSNISHGLVRRKVSLNLTSSKQSTTVFSSIISLASTATKR